MATASETRARLLLLLRPPADYRLPPRSRIVPSGRLVDLGVDDRIRGRKR